MRNKGASIVAVVVIVIVAMGIVGYLSLHKIDTQPFLFGFGIIAAPALGILYNNFKTSEIANKVDNVATKVDTIEENTNGKLTAQFAEVHSKIDEITNNGKETP